VKKKEKIRVVGAGHSMSDITLTSDNMINLDLMDKILSVNQNAKTVTVEAGIRLKHLSQLLVPYNLSLQNVGSVSEQSVAGAISTGTHGTGILYPSLSNTVLGVEIVTGQGEVRSISANTNPELLPAVRLSLGTLGVITSVTLQLVPARDIRREEATVRVDLMRDHFLEKVKNNDHCLFWWIAGSHIARYYVMNPTSRKGPLTEVNFRSDFERNLDENFIAKISAIAFRALSNYPALWKPFLQFAFKFIGPVGFNDRSDLALTMKFLFQYQEIEYSVALKDTIEVFNELRELFNNNKELAVNGPVTVRTVREDDTWLSPQYKRDAALFSLTVMSNNDKFNLVSHEVEKIFTKYGGRPHWAKTFYKSNKELEEIYPKMNEFKKIREKFDPDGIFVNDYVKRVLGL